jgi:hypothetical protein
LGAADVAELHEPLPEAESISLSPRTASPAASSIPVPLARHHRDSPHAVMKGS